VYSLSEETIYSNLKQKFLAGTGRTVLLRDKEISAASQFSIRFVSVALLSQFSSPFNKNDGEWQNLIVVENK
jgi:hypothetical protein